MSAQDPFYLVKEEIQELVHGISRKFSRWEQLPPGTPERDNLFKDLSASCESIEWQLEELSKAVAVAEKDPARFSVDEAEVARRRQWTTATSGQIASIRRQLLSAVTERSSPPERDGAGGGRRELIRMPPAGPRPDQDIVRGNDAFVAGEEDHQALLIREQDSQLDEMSVSLAKIGGMGRAIHEELGEQDKIITDLEHDVVSTNSRLEAVQKKMAAVMKKAGVKGQLMLIVFLVVLLIILVVLLIYS